MKRLACLIVLVGMTAAGSSLAADPAFCQSMCGSTQRECRAGAQLQPKEERLMANAEWERNPLARTAQGEVPGQGTRALKTAGDNHRREARIDACEASYQRCTRSCAVDAGPREREPVRTGAGKGGS